MSDIFIVSIPTPLCRSTNDQETGISKPGISKTGKGRCNSSQGPKTFFWGQYVDANKRLAKFRQEIAGWTLIPT